MKKILYAAIAVIIVVFSSCSHRSSNIVVPVSFDTAINVTKVTVRTSPRYACATGKRLPQDRLDGVDSTTIQQQIHSNKNVLVSSSDNARNAIGSDCGCYVCGLPWWLASLIGLILLVLLIGLIAKLINDSKHHRTYSNHSSSTVTQYNNGSRISELTELVNAMGIHSANKNSYLRYRTQEMKLKIALGDESVAKVN
ncbi:MAG TPA: hypothetical protein VG982_01850 [Candidatus Paceibacterota bacterium]|nr:hypothetical protein [Candidatus Paceibacterota bacterium]